MMLEPILDLVSYSIQHVKLSSGGGAKARRRRWLAAGTIMVPRPQHRTACHRKVPRGGFAAAQDDTL